MADKKTEPVSEAQNNNVFLVGGDSTNGKSTSLMFLDNPEGVLYLNCENGKNLPFKSKFDERKIQQPQHVLDAFVWAEKQQHIHTIVVDSASYLMELFETKIIATAKDTRKAWGEYSLFLKKLMHVYVSGSTKNIIFTGHLTEDFNEDGGFMERKMTLKGGMKNLGFESFLTTVVHAVRVPLKDLEPFKNEYLNITEEDEIEGFKYCYLTRRTKNDPGRRVRAPMGMWDKSETYIDNNAQYVLNKLSSYYTE